MQALDKVLEILRTSELYSPYFAQEMKGGDPITSDYLGGLVSVSEEVFYRFIVFFCPVTLSPTSNDQYVKIKTIYTLVFFYFWA